MKFGRISRLFGPKRFGSLPGIYDPTTLQYPPGLDCIFTSDDEININDWLPDDTGGTSNLATATGEIKTVIGIYYPAFYTGPIGNWTEAEIREKLTNDLEEQIYNFSNGNAKLVGPTGGQVMIDGPRQFVGTTPNAFDNYHFPCNSAGATGMVGQSYAALAAACPTCDIGASLALACPQDSLEPPGGFQPIQGLATGGLGGIRSVTWTDGMAGYNGTNATLAGTGCDAAPGINPGNYIAENDVEILEIGRMKLVMLHEILHTLGWPHTSKPQAGSTWCPTFIEQNGPNLPCSDVTAQYNSLDNLAPMSFSAGCQNPYSVYEAHPNAATKYIRGLGLTSQDTGTWLPDNAVLSLDLSPGQSTNVRLYAHDTAISVKKDVLRDVVTGGVAGDAQTVDPTTGEGVIPYLIKIKRPVDVSQSSDSWPVDDKALFISYRMNAWYARKEHWSPAGGAGTLWSQGGYLNGSVHIDWGPVNLGGKSTVITLAKLDAEDVRIAPAPSNRTYDSYFANGTSYPQIKVRIIENLGSTPTNARHGPLSILVNIEAL